MAGRPLAFDPSELGCRVVMSRAITDGAGEEGDSSPSFLLAFPLRGQGPQPSSPHQFALSPISLRNGLHFPFRALVLEFLNFVGLAPIQVLPNAWKFFTFVEDTFRGLGIEPTLNHLRLIFSLRPDHPGYYYLAFNREFQSPTYKAVRVHWEKSWFFLTSNGTALPFPNWGGPARRFWADACTVAELEALRRYWEATKDGGGREGIDIERRKEARLLDPDHRPVFDEHRFWNLIAGKGPADVGTPSSRKRSRRRSRGASLKRKDVGTSDPPHPSGRRRTRSASRTFPAGARRDLEQEMGGEAPSVEIFSSSTSAGTREEAPASFEDAGVEEEWDVPLSPDAPSEFDRGEASEARPVTTDEILLLKWVDEASGVRKKRVKRVTSGPSRRNVQTSQREAGHISGSGGDSDPLPPPPGGAEGGPSPAATTSRVPSYLKDMSLEECLGEMARHGDLAQLMTSQVVLRCRQYRKDAAELQVERDQLRDEGSVLATRLAIAEEKLLAREEEVKELKRRLGPCPDDA